MTEPTGSQPRETPMPPPAARPAEIASDRIAVEVDVDPHVSHALQENGVPQMATKGRLQEGMDADITICDPVTVTDNSTMEDGGLPTTGLPFVLVNGTVVVRDSRNVDDVFPGRPITGSATAA